MGYEHRNVVFNYENDDNAFGLQEITEEVASRGRVLGPATFLAKKRDPFTDVLWMRKLIVRSKHEFKYKAKDKEFNPMELRNKCAYITGGYLPRSLSDRTQVGAVEWGTLKAEAMSPDFIRQP